MHVFFVGTSNARNRRSSSLDSCGVNPMPDAHRNRDWTCTDQGGRLKERLVYRVLTPVKDRRFVVVDVLAEGIRGRCG